METGFYPYPPRGGRREDGDVAHHAVVISIHALREEGDPVFANLGEQAILFLSTPSARRATGSRSPRSRRRWYFYPRPPRGGRRFDAMLPQPGRQISIHALREEGDRLSLVLRSVCLHFYPRPPRGGRPRHLDKRSHKHIISIHALREEGDLLWGDTVHRPIQFLSTPSARRATLDLPFSA